MELKSFPGSFAIHFEKFKTACSFSEGLMALSVCTVMYFLKRKGFLLSAQ